MTESQVKQIQIVQEAIARLTESNNNLAHNQQAIAESKRARKQSAKGVENGRYTDTTRN